MLVAGSMTDRAVIARLDRQAAIQKMRPGLPGATVVVSTR